MQIYRAFSGLRYKDMTSPVCSKCGGVMIEGFIIDHPLGQSAFPAQWHPGTPECNVFGGTQIDKEKLVPIQSFRCEQCGYLELYSRKD